MHTLISVLFRSLIDKNKEFLFCEEKKASDRARYLEVLSTSAFFVATLLDTGVRSERAAC